jgi:hypothetical protein
MTRIDRALKHLAGSQETARTNAAEASAGLRERRQEGEEVDAYLEALRGMTLREEAGPPAGRAGVR